MTLEKSIRSIESLASSVDPELASNLSTSFSRLAWVLSSENLAPAKRAKILTQLNTYLLKKADEFDPTLIEEQAANLRKIRNELAHGKLQRNRDFSPLYPTLWKAIVKLGNKLGPFEIENLLAYSLKVQNMHISKNGTTPTKVVSVYRTMFNTQDTEEKRRIFADLLLRLFSDNESMMLLNVGTKR